MRQGVKSMKPLIRYVTVGSLAVCCTWAEAATPTQEGPPGHGQTARSSESEALAPGIPLQAELTKGLDSKKAKPGDAVSAQLTEPVRVDGKVLVRKGTKLEGHVTRASAKGNGDSDSALAVQFDRAVTKEGQSLPLKTRIQALASDQRVAAVNGDELEPANRVGGASGSTGNRNTGAMPGQTVGSAASGAASTVPRTVEDQSGTTGPTESSANGQVPPAERGLSPSGDLLPTSRGVYNLRGLTLNAETAGSAGESVIVSNGKSVHLDGGTKMLLVTESAATTAER
jgi:hypothetical protein